MHPTLGTIACATEPTCPKNVNRPCESLPCEHAAPLQDVEVLDNLPPTPPGVQQPICGTADPGVVKQDKSSRGSVDTTKTRSDPQRVTMSSGERPIGTAKGKQPDTEALCQPPPPVSNEYCVQQTLLFGPYFFRTRGDMGGDIGHGGGGKNIGH